MKVRKEKIWTIVSNYVVRGSVKVLAEPSF